ncbi:hypothetical protein PXK01_16610 [Phaeobacter sp. PT47_59]|uniref:hypothetical protein n=1 Tax=Phaeobacter sp. PT47_59 TaxID=3029979 RepID=UPI0023808D63|nr:hypothetical protein [Phaeobacter sp. PT47_59]MDE4175786.1 hypothetical protein [Phaeobacter sp. PT47_59]
MKNKDKILNILGGIAPTIATALGGPLAGVATKALASKLLDRPDATEEEVEAAILGAAPQDLLKLKEADADLERHLIDAGIELEKVAANDRDSARNRQIATKDRVPGLLAAVILIGYFSVLAYLITYGLPAASEQILALLIGALTAGLTQVLNFYFGSSVGSKNKDAVIAGMKGGAA